MNTQTYNNYIVDPRLCGIKIACLPRDFDTIEKTKVLVEQILQLGIVKSIKLKNKNIDTRTITTALIEFSQFNYESPIVKNLAPLPENYTFEYKHPVFVFVWPDGRGHMKHLSLQKYLITNILSYPPNLSNEILGLPDGAWTSIHIPVLTNMFLDVGNGIHQVFNPREHLQDFIENKLAIGKVRRIDFVERDDIFVNQEGKIYHIVPNVDEDGSPKNPETETKPEPNVLAAFIHMEFWFNNQKTQQIRYNLDTHGQFHMRGFNDLYGFHNFYGKNGNEHYFVLKINHKPIPDADGKLNVHQLTAMNVKLKEEFANYEAEIKRLSQENLDLIQRLQTQIAEDLNLGA